LISLTAVLAESPEQKKERRHSWLRVETGKPGSTPEKFLVFLADYHGKPMDTSDFLSDMASSRVYLVQPASHHAYGFDEDFRNNMVPNNPE